MKIQAFVSKVVLVVLVFSLIPVSAFSAPKITPGSTCKVLNQKITYLGKTYTCTKFGKKLIWSKGVAAKPAPTPSVTPEPSPSKTPSIEYQRPTQASADIEVCKIKERSSNRLAWPDSQLPTGFPGLTHAVKTGTVKWALIPIDFSDLPGEADFRSRVNNQMKMASDWFATSSEGKFKVEWVVADNWVRVAGQTSEYKIDRSDNLERVPNAVKLWNDAIAASDRVFDFSGVQTVNFILPQGQSFVKETLQGFPWQPEVTSVKTNEGSITSFSIPGKFMDTNNRQYWTYWVHEFGHAMALPHIGSSRIPNPFLGLDIMSNQDGESRELSGWMRFVAGWLPDERVYCKEISKLQSTDITLVPLGGVDPGIKMVVLSISETKALIIESRRESKFSCTMPSIRSGVLAYLYDATKSHGENFLDPVVPVGRTPESSSNCPVATYPNPILYKDEKIVVDGVSIEVIESLNYDKIRISKAS